jgi:prolyl-tRNA synthetase
MRRSELFCETLREKPADSDIAGHQLLLRGGFIQPLAAGIYSFLPLGLRVKAKIEHILREEMNRIGGQEVFLPVVQPGELWQETGRWEQMGSAMTRFRDRAERDLVLAMTHEEVVTDLLRKRIRSYRQLPLMLYQIQTKFRDEPRARAGLLRAREFTMKDAYSAHASVEDRDRYYATVYESYFRIFERCGLEVIGVEADVGMMGGSVADELVYVTEIGEDQIVLCDGCGYAANRQIATFRKEQPAAEDLRPIEEIATPATATIAALAALLDVPESRTAKATFFVAGERLIFAVVRGDMEVNETKLARLVGATELRPARLDELEGTGIVPGYASPIGVVGATVVADDLIAQSPNLVAGANREGYHLLNTNLGRDYEADTVADIVAAEEGAACPRCGLPVRIIRGVEVVNTFRLDTRYSAAIGATFLDETGEARPIVMASYGIVVGRLMACIAEEHRDERGLLWPSSVAPFEVYLVGLDGGDEQVRSAAENLYAGLLDADVEVLYDDRDERPGVKFNDADLLGIPLRVTVSRRTVREDSVELKPRNAETPRLIRSDETVATLKSISRGAGVG